MYSMFPAPLAILLKLQFPLHHLFILTGVVINPLAGGAFHFDYVLTILRSHTFVPRY